MNYFDFTTHSSYDNQPISEWNFRLQYENSVDPVGVHIQINSKEPYRLYPYYKGNKDVLVAFLTELILVKAQELNPAYKFTRLRFKKATSYNIGISAYFVVATLLNHE